MKAYLSSIVTPKWIRTRKKKKKVDEGQSLYRLCVWVKWCKEEEKERGKFWNQVESRRKKKEKKREDGDIWVYVCGGEKTRERKKKKETYGWNKGIGIFFSK